MIREFSQTGGLIQRVGWYEIEEVSRKLVDALRTKGPFSGIVAVTRGGLVPAAIVAHGLDLQIVETVSVSSYGEGRARSEPVIVRSPKVANHGHGYLIIDDLVDTGETARAVRASMLERAYFACLFAKPAGKPFANLFISEVPQDTWLVFPWERN